MMRYYEALEYHIGGGGGVGGDKMIPDNLLMLKGRKELKTKTNK